MQKRLLIQNADYILTMDSARTCLRHANMLVEGNTIVSVGEPITDTASFDRIVDARGFIIIPGMVNVHHHCAHTLVRNLGSIFFRSHAEILRAIYGRLAYFNPASMRAAALGGLGDLLKTGCTTSCDHHYVFPRGQSGLLDAEIDIAKQLGIRFHALRGSLSVGKASGCDFIPDTMIESTEQIVEDTLRTIETHHDASHGSMLRVGVAPTWIPYETPSIIQASVELAQHYNVQLHSHLADTREEFAMCKEKFNCTPIEYAHKMNCLQANSVFTHCIS